MGDPDSQPDEEGQQGLLRGPTPRVQLRSLRGHEHDRTHHPDMEERISQERNTFSSKDFGSGQDPPLCYTLVTPDLTLDTVRVWHPKCQSALGKLSRLARRPGAR